MGIANFTLSLYIYSHLKQVLQQPHPLRLDFSKNTRTFFITSRFHELAFCILLFRKNIIFRILSIY